MSEDGSIEETEPDNGDELGERKECQINADTIFHKPKIYFRSNVKICMKGVSDSIFRDFVSEKVSPH